MKHYWLLIVIQLNTITRGNEITNQFNYLLNFFFFFFNLNFINEAQVLNVSYFREMCFKWYPLTIFYFKKLTRKSMPQMSVIHTNTVANLKLFARMIERKIRHAHDFSLDDVNSPMWRILIPQHNSLILNSGRDISSPICEENFNFVVTLSLSFLNFRAKCRVFEVPTGEKNKWILELSLISLN